MEHQLVLIDEEPREWRLDDQTRLTGRRGLAEARAALSDAARRQLRRGRTAA